jgi:ribose 5-phosphate isomerase A
MPVPVEISVFGMIHTERRLQQLGASTTLRRRPNGSLYLTDGGNAIVDCQFTLIDDPGSLDRQLQSMAGVLETGLFLNLCDTLIVGVGDGFERIETGVRDRA